MKKILIIISVVLILFLLSLVGYYFIVGTNPSDPNSPTTGFRSFFPFGGNDNPTTNEPAATTTVNTPETPQIQTNFAQKLRKISTEQVSGVGTLDVKAGVVLRYIEKATGHIYEVEMFSPKQARISNTTIPLVYDALWGNKNNSLVARYIKDDDHTLDTYSLTIKISTTTENTIAGVAFPANVSDISVFDTNVFYLVQNETLSTGYVSDFGGLKKKLIWNSEIKELNSQFVNAKTVALTTKPAQNIDGFTYLVDTTTGVVKKLLGNVAGLSTLVGPDGTKAIYLKQNSNTQMFLFDQKNNLVTGLTPATFPEKCVWSNKNKDMIYCAVPKNTLSGGSLTSWYRGFISFDDDIWKYDLKNNTASIIESLSNDSGEAIDVTKPILSENEQYLVFINKIDGKLWSLDLAQVTQP